MGDPQGAGTSWEEAPRPRSRRWIALGTAAVVAAGAVAVALTGPTPGGTLAVRPEATPQPAPPAAGSEPAPRPGPAAEVVAATTGSGPLLPDGADFTVIASGATGWRAIDVATGAVTRWRITGVQDLSRTLFLSGDDLIITLGLGPADVVRVAPEGRTVRIARRRQAVPTIAGGPVWVHDGLSDDFGGAASLVDLNGSIRERIVLPSLTRPAVGLHAGLLVTTGTGTAIVSDDGSRHVWEGGTVAAADATRVAHVTCDPAPSCEILLGTFDEPDTHRLRLAPGDVPGGYLGPGLGAFSGDGRWLALPVFTHPARIVGPGPTERAVDRLRRPRSYLSIIDTATGEEVGRPEGSDQPFTSALAWSRDSRWLVFASGDGIAVWDTVRRRTTRLALGPDDPPRAIAVR